MFQILHCMVHYIDISSPSSSVLNSELIHVISKHVEVTYSAPETALKMILQYNILCIYMYNWDF